MSRRAVFLDRDGVLNRAVVRDGKPYPPKDAAHAEIFLELREPLSRLKNAGFVLIVVTNQPDVARGTTSKAVVEEINRRIARELAVIDRFIVCFHDNADNCDCRKPRPGMLIAGAAEFGVDLKRSYMVGDRRNDMAAGAAVGARTVFIDYGYSEPAPKQYGLRVSSARQALETIELEIEHEKD